MRFNMHKASMVSVLENPSLLERKACRDLMEVFMRKVNRFEEGREDLVTLDNKVCESVAAALYLYVSSSQWDKTGTRTRGRV